MTHRFFGKRARVLAYGVVAFALAQPVGAEPVNEPLTRRRAIALALAQSPRIDSVAAGELVARAHVGQARAARGPSITAAIATGPSLRATLVPGTGAASTENIYGDVGLDDLSIVIGGRFEIAQPLYTFGKIAEREQAAKHELRARGSETEMARAELALRVAEIYESLLFARAAQAFFEETQHWVTQMLDDTRQEVQTGSSTAQDVARLEAALAGIRLGLHQASAGKRQAEAGLRAYLVLPQSEPLAVAGDGVEPLPIEAGDEHALVVLALARRPELRALREGNAAYEALARAEAAGDWPDFFALAFASAAYTPGRDVADSRYVQDPLNGFYPGVLFGARWQLTWGMASERAAEQRASAKQLSALEEFARSGIPAEVTRAYEDVQRAKADLVEAGRGMSSAKAWLVGAEADAAVGIGPSSDIADAARAYVELRVASFDAAFRHNVALAALARATGTLGDPNSSTYPGKEESDASPR
ncbi:MAG TPA: TolC family protein [Polyangiaceae bacterium]|nr:TolC family protein [Polyangiaceae bacterium]